MNFGTIEQVLSGEEKCCLLRGDCVSLMKLIPDNSLDSIVTDPPYLIEFGGKDWDKAEGEKIAATEQVFRAWLAGLIAGEGCFRIHKEKSGAYYACKFSIHMRADEGPLLRALMKRTGLGKICEVEGGISKHGITSSDSLIWYVQSKSECRKLANMLSSVPLYAKKQREFDLWLRALEAWENTPDGRAKPGGRGNGPMEALYEEMKELRPFDEDLADSTFNPFGPPDYQFHYRWAQEAFRVLKPGGHLCAFGASRTYHRLACAIEDAGFEIRDTIDMIYGSGAAHSKDASKAIDIYDGTSDRRPIIGSYTVSGNAGTSTAEKGGTFGVGVPNSEAKQLHRTTGATERSQAWDGWQTALAPGKEPVVLARKPLDGTLAENLIVWKVGALNIDACRIATDFGDRGESWKRSGHTANPDADKIGNPPGQGMMLHPKGRWAKNVVFVHDSRCQKIGQRETKTPIVNRHVGGPRFFGDAVGADFVIDGGEPTTEVVYECVPECPVFRLGEQSGTSTSPSIDNNRIRVYSGPMPEIRAGSDYDDSGTAARYFTQLEWTEPDFELFRYIKKPSTATKEAGCEAIEKKATTDRKPGSAAMACPSTGAGRTVAGRHNDHTTVKPVEFVRFLVRLVTPVGGVTLSPFVGSGTDAIAAQAEGMLSIGFDLDEHDRNIRIAKSRVNYWTEDECKRLHAGIKPTIIKKDDRQQSLFGDP